MTVIVCVDDKMGVLFNCRRQSKDRILRERILELSKNTLLWMSPYSQKQFEDNDANNICVADNFMIAADNDSFCFSEGTALSPCLEKIDRIILYKWNRVYPSDETFDVDLSNWSLQSTFEFQGRSHEKITEEVYVKNA